MRYRLRSVFLITTAIAFLLALNHLFVWRIASNPDAGTRFVFHISLAGTRRPTDLDRFTLFDLSYALDHSHSGPHWHLRWLEPPTSSCKGEGYCPFCNQAF